MALALIVGVFAALRKLITQDNLTIKLIAKQLKLESLTRRQFLVSIVASAQEFLQKKSNQNDFQEMLSRTEKEETEKGQPLRRALKGSSIAGILANRSKTEITKLFDLIYGYQSFSRGEVCSPFFKVLMCQGRG